MISLQRLVGRTDRFFTLLEAGADEVSNAAKALRQMIDEPDDAATLEKVKVFRREEKRIRDEINRLVCNTFITPFDREDIDALSSALSRISKIIKKFAERLVVLKSHFRANLFARQAELLRQSTDTLNEMIRLLRQPKLDTVQAANDRLHQFEGDADKQMLSFLQELYSGQYDALQMIVLRDLSELLEKVIDRCRDAGNVVLQIVLKNS